MLVTLKERLLALLEKPMRHLVSNAKVVGIAALGAAVLMAGAVQAQTAAADAEGIEFFEKKIRPVLVERCYECHSSQAKKLEGALSLESREGVLKGGDQGPAVVPGDLDKSLLIRAIRYTDEDLLMPPKPKERLPKEVLADFEAWVKRGAPDPRVGTAAAASGYSVDIEAAKKRWPYSPPVKPAIPVVRDASWPRTDIDRFILAKLEERTLAPADDADKRALLRRLTYDLTGLPPTPDEIDAFLGDPGTNAYETVIDRLLASSHYGERWGRHWLDVVRYADTAGDNSDYPIPQMYKYRNWVINAFNADLPFDQFIREQLAGDLLPSNSVQEKYDKIIATGYLANARRFGSRVSDYPQHLTIEDTIDNLGRAFMGLSLNCARCHNHKFEPVTTEDYYALYGIFHSTRYPWPGIELEKKQRDLVALAAEDVVTAAKAERKRHEEPIAAEVKATEEAKKAADQLADAVGQRLEALRKQEVPAEQMTEAEKEAEAAKKRAKDYAEVAKTAKKKKTDLDNTPLPYDTAYAVSEGSKIENCKIQMKGDPERLGVEVPRRFPAVLGGQTLTSDAKGSGRRELAEWIASANNSLTARVFVNRLWHYHFGRGLVPTPNDFGKQGKLPSHPELLDYLALRFIESGWSVKAMHRLILMSRTYQLSSTERIQGLMAADPSNELFGRFNRRRLDAESIRDTLLVLGGNLDRSIGDTHPFPPQKEWDFTQHKPFKAVYDSNRRSVYLMTQRIQRHPLMATFDGPDTSASTGARPASTTTLQALYFLNDSFVHEQADRLATRIVSSRTDDDGRIELAYELLFGREPTADERQMAKDYFARLPANAADGSSDDQVAAKRWTSLIRVLLRTNEFVYLE
jgi:hypothetical protein